jgi:hypothetical protein
MEKKTFISRELHRKIKEVGFIRYDGRKKMFRDSGITKDEYRALAAYSGDMRVKRHINRRYDTESHFAKVRDIIGYFSNIMYEDEFNRTYGDGYICDDWESYQRPSSNGIGYCAIVPGERGNNFYTEDPVAVKILRRKWEEHYMAHGQDLTKE